MKKYVSRGFTLVELMIVIAIIGILAAVLYPAMTGYFERSRDTNRTGAMNQLSLSIGTYFSDNNKYPKPGTNGCLDEIETLLVPTNGTAYIKSLPKDPKNGNKVDDSCVSGYGYKGLTANGGAYDADNLGAYMMAAKMEIKANGNAELSTFTSANTTDTPNTFKTTVTTKGSQTSSTNDVAWIVLNQ